MPQDQLTVAIVDDNPDSRDSFGYTVEDANLSPLPEVGPLGDVQEAAGAVLAADVLLSDYNLGARNYASFTGAELVAARQRAGQPSILCTKYERQQIERIRPYRRWIPTLLSPDELEPESLLAAIARGKAELRQEFEPVRKPWRTLVRFTEADQNDETRFYVEIPSWDPGIPIPIYLNTLPSDIRESVRSEFRCHAMVNLASDSYEDLYLDSWVSP